MHQYGMHRSRFWRFPVLLVIAAMIFAACGSDEPEETTGGDDEGSAATKTVKIGVIAPLSGELSALGLGIRNGAQLAVNQANEEEKIEGWTIELVPEDDTAKADVGAQVATKLASDSEVAAVIGTLNSSVALQVAPILERANIAMVSPANTGVELTGRDNLANQARRYKNYYRVATTDDIQGPFAANYATEELNAKNVVIIHDKKTYGQGLAAAFQGQFEKNGGKVVGAETINPGDKDFSAVLSKIKPSNPDLIYYGGEYPEASLLSSQAKQQGIQAPLMGGDGIYSGQYFATAKEAGIGDLATSVGAPTDELESAKDFVEAYNADAELSKDPYEAYGAYSFDAANVIIEALAQVLGDAESLDDAARTQIIEEIGNVSLDGVTGKVAFDEFGDTTTKVLTVYRGEDRSGTVTWVAAKTDEFS
jgi:branched-chain amino acid transport system substrate-binding protein